jgi:peroxiredoxin
LQKDLASLEAKKVQLVGLSYDAVDVLSEFSDRWKITFPLLSDPDSATIKAFGLINAEAKGKAEGVPYPGVMMLDKDRTIRAKLFFDSYRQRHTAADILQVVGEIK